ncbi:MAG: RNA-binding S4 domain-containing protein [Paracoccaceae bacterium]
MRADKWLWQARFFKTRAPAARMIEEGRLRLNGVRVAKPAQNVGPGDELSFPQAGRMRAIRVEAVGVRRGPASEAQALYTDLDPSGGEASAETRAGARPTKKARRDLDALHRGET